MSEILDRIFPVERELDNYELARVLADDDGAPFDINIEADMSEDEMYWSSVEFPDLYGYGAFDHLADPDTDQRQGKSR